MRKKLFCEVLGFVNVIESYGINPKNAGYIQILLSLLATSEVDLIFEGKLRRGDLIKPFKVSSISNVTNANLG